MKLLAPMKTYISIVTVLVSPLFLLSTSVPMIKVAVFCSADNKVSQQFKIAAYSLGQRLSKANFGLVTGGSKTGLMKELIDGYVDQAESTNHLYGIMPYVLAPYDVHHQAIPVENLKRVETLHVRLATFHELADVVIVLPGGFGTLHELMDFLVHNQFALSKKSIILINTDGYWNSLLAQFQVMVDHNLLSSVHLSILQIALTVDECIDILINKRFSATGQGLADLYWQKQ